MSDPKKVFITYTHDSDAHKDQVLAFANKLRKQGVDADIDQFDSTKEEGLERWMINKLNWADIALIVCTEAYHKKILGVEKGGANFEGFIILQQMNKAGMKNKKFRAIGFLPYKDNPYIHDMLTSWDYYNVSDSAGYIELYAWITDQNTVVKADLGEVEMITPRNPA